MYSCCTVHGTYNSGERERETGGRRWRVDQEMKITVTLFKILTDFSIATDFCIAKPSKYW